MRLAVLILNPVSLGEKKCPPEAKHKPSVWKAELERPPQNKHIPFSLQRPPIWNSMGTRTVDAVCGPLLAVVCHLPIHAAVFTAFKVKRSSIFPPSLLLFQCTLVQEDMKCSI